jgi:hypothetical protein
VRWLTGSVSFRATFVNSEDFFHFSGLEKFSATLIPVDGQGPTYVESQRPAHTIFTARAVDGGFDQVQTFVNNDRFTAYVDGKKVASQTIRIQELEHVVGVDTDGDNVPDDVKISIDVHRFSCPT